MEFVIKALIAGSIVSFASWMAGRMPILAGFLVARPISTAILLPMAYFEHGSFEQTVVLAKSVAVAVPLTLSFFVPFFLASRFGLGFWAAYPLAFVCLGAGFLVHRAIMSWLVSNPIS
ncbi:MAG: hypothetical protein VCC04_09225 [Myxococcota bacterium]